MRYLQFNSALTDSKKRAQLKGCSLYYAWNIISYPGLRQGKWLLALTFPQGSRDGRVKVQKIMILIKVYTFSLLMSSSTLSFALSS